VLQTAVSSQCACVPCPITFQHFRMARRALACCERQRWAGMLQAAAPMLCTLPRVVADP
jgi:hypothetical protein